MKFGIIANPRKPALRKVLPELIVWLEAKGCEYVIEEGASEFSGIPVADLEIVSRDEVPSKSDMLLAMGGDGTILAAARMVGNTGVPIIGVNLGSLGFLAEVAMNDMHKRLEQVLDGDYILEERMVLKATIDNDESSSIRALNDVVVGRQLTSRMLGVTLTVDGNYFNKYNTDGLIVSTPTGSTAYSLSAGGPIIVPSLQAMTVTPISPHSLTARPVVLRADSHIEISFEESSRDLLLSIDGQRDISIKGRQVVSVERAKNNVKLVRWTDRTFFDTLSAKLDWGYENRKKKKGLEA